MSKYLITESDRIEIKLYIDDRKERLKVYDSNEIKTITAAEISVLEARLSTLAALEENETVKEEKKIIGDKLAALKLKGYPEYITVESTFWQKMDGAASEYISKKGYDRLPNRPATYNNVEHNKAFIAALLKDWTLSKTDSRLTLKTEQMQGFTDRKILDNGTMEIICKLDNNLYSAIVNTSYAQLMGLEEEKN